LAYGIVVWGSEYDKAGLVSKMMESEEGHLNGIWGRIGIFFTIQLAKEAVGLGHKKGSILYY
jgi:hypothetical protein